MVQVCHRLVEEQDRSLGDQSPSQPEPRALSPGDTASAGTDGRVESLSEVGEPLAQTCPVHGLDELRIRGARSRQLEVGPQG